MPSTIVKPDILNLTPIAFIDLLKRNGIKAFHIVYIDGKVQARRICSPHIRGPAAGGVRNWSYTSIEGLAKGMCHKNALAGLWWGGGKGVMARNTGVGLLPGDSVESRRVAYEEYGAFLSTLKGVMTRHTTCIPEELGGSGNPSVPTARGVVKGLEAAFNYLGKTINGSSIAVQGIGHVGTPLIHFLFEHGVGRIIASDVDKHREEISFRIVEKSDMTILFEDVDAVSPCATGIKAKIVCGAANNQLLDIKTHDKLLKKHDLVYIPDFLCNRMGIVNCADEASGSMEDDPKLELHLGKKWENSIYNLSLKVLNDAKESGKTTQEIAVALADEQSRNEAWRKHVGLI
ncbi:hypothetical protein BC829DRAFT_406080 [Chytridium lagenaria]|nr:hypothetical protein BC829DRAFT_406080 [Chytridium lagenaria]